MGKHQRHAPHAPGLQQRFVVVQCVVQAGEAGLPHPHKGRSLPGAGRRVLQPAGPGGLRQPACGQRGIQMMGMQPVGQRLLFGQYRQGQEKHPLCVIGRKKL